MQKRQVGAKPIVMPTKILQALQDAPTNDAPNLTVSCSSGDSAPCGVNGPGFVPAPPLIGYPYACSGNFPFGLGISYSLTSALPAAGATTTGTVTPAQAKSVQFLPYDIKTNVGAEPYVLDDDGTHAAYLATQCYIGMVDDGGTILGPDLTPAASGVRYRWAVYFSPSSGLLQGAFKLATGNCVVLFSQQATPGKPQPFDGEVAITAIDTSSSQNVAVVTQGAAGYLTYCQQSLEVDGVHRTLPKASVYSGYPIPFQNVRWQLTPVDVSPLTYVNVGCPAPASTQANLVTNGVCLTQDSAFKTLISSTDVTTVETAKNYVLTNCIFAAGGNSGIGCRFTKSKDELCSRFNATGTYGLNCRSMMNVLDTDTSTGPAAADGFRNRICVENGAVWDQLKNSVDCSCLNAVESSYETPPVNASYKDYVKKLHDIGFKVPFESTQCWWPACTADRRFVGVLQNSDTNATAQGCTGAIASCINAIGSVDVSQSSQLQIVIDDTCNGVLVQTSNISGKGTWSSSGTSGEGDSGVPGTPAQVLAATAPLGAFAPTPNGVPHVVQRTWFPVIFWLAILIVLGCIIGIVVGVVMNRKYYKLGLTAGTASAKTTLASEKNVGLEPARK
jgi:hypothetical protein